MCWRPGPVSPLAQASLPLTKDLPTRWQIRESTQDTGGPSEPSPGPRAWFWFSLLGQLWAGSTQCPRLPDSWPSQSRPLGPSVNFPQPPTGVLCEWVELSWDSGVACDAGTRLRNPVGSGSWAPRPRQAELLFDDSRARRVPRESSHPKTPGLSRPAPGQEGKEDGLGREEVILGS